MDETKRLIVKEVNCTPNAKILTITLSVSKTFLAKYLLDDSGDGTMELIDGERLEQI
jgi:hypothetical protein